MYNIDLVVMYDFYFRLCTRFRSECLPITVLREVNDENWFLSPLRDGYDEYRKAVLS